MNERILAGPHMSFLNGFYGKSQMNKTKEKIVVIKNKLCIGNIKFYVKSVLIVLNWPPKMKMNGYESFLEYDL